MKKLFKSKIALAVTAIVIVAVVAGAGTWSWFVATAGGGDMVDVKGAILNVEKEGTSIVKGGRITSTDNKQTFQFSSNTELVNSGEKKGPEANSSGAFIIYPGEGVVFASTFKIQNNRAAILKIELGSSVTGETLADQLGEVVLKARDLVGEVMDTNETLFGNNLNISGAYGDNEIENISKVVNSSGNTVPELIFNSLFAPINYNKTAYAGIGGDITDKSDLTGAILPINRTSIEHELYIDFTAGDMFGTTGGELTYYAGEAGVIYVYVPAEYFNGASKTFKFVVGIKGFNWNQSYFKDAQITLNSTPIITAVQATKDAVIDVFYKGVTPNVNSFEVMLGTRAPDHIGTASGSPTSNVSWFDHD